MYNKNISNEDRKRIINAYLNGSKPKQIANIMCIKITTIYSIINIYKTENRINKNFSKISKSKKLSDEQINILKDWIDEDCTLTLNKLKLRILTTFNINITEKSISNYIKQFNYSFKRITLQPILRNNSEIISKRRIYADEFMRLSSMQSELNFIFIDEVGVSLSMRGRYGRSLIGTPAIKTVSSIRSRNISICCAINKNEIIHYFAQTKPFNTSFFSTFIIQLCNKLKQKQIANCILIMDNIAFHKVSIVKELILNYGHQFLFLPPYSPFLNPIENAFSKWKEFIRRNNPNTEQELISLIESGANAISTENCNNFYRHMLGYIPRCLRELAIEN